MTLKQPATRFDDLVITHWHARFRGRVFPCAVGCGGIGLKSGEGDGITPIGQFRLVGGGYRVDRVAMVHTGLPMHVIGPYDIWSDDPRDPHYNHGLCAFNYRYGHEKLRRADPLYDLYAVLDYNWPDAIAGRGSAIFLHVWRAPRVPTQGCIAFNQADLLWVLAHWGDKSRVIIRG